jgi:hypothetical protein
MLLLLIVIIGGLLIDRHIASDWTFAAFLERFGKLKANGSVAYSKAAPERRSYYVRFRSK